MATSSTPSRTYLSRDFVVSAGCILFRRSPQTQQLQICLLYHTVKKEWLLPKGRKDCGENVQDTAVRETYEETGYQCQLLPSNMLTRAPSPGVHTKDMVHSVQGSTEPIAITIRETGPNRDRTRTRTEMKMIWWYVGIVIGDGIKIEGTQMASERFESEFIDADEAVRRLTFIGDQEIAAQALEIVRQTNSI